jgi:hypothetical protein
MTEEAKPKGEEINGINERPAYTERAVSPPTPQTPSLYGHAEIVRFIVYAEGIRPSIAYASPGLVQIYVEDLAGISLGLVVRQEVGPVLGQVVRTAGRSRGSVRVRLEPGRYQIYDASRPRNSATLIVQP